MIGKALRRQEPLLRFHPNQSNSGKADGTIPFEVCRLASRDRIVARSTRPALETGRRFRLTSASAPPAVVCRGAA